jgi:hypothetical protein
MDTEPPPPSQCIRLQKCCKIFKYLKKNIFYEIPVANTKKVSIFNAPKRFFSKMLFLGDFLSLKFLSKMNDSDRTK